MITMSIQKHDLETKKLFLQRTFDICAGFLAHYLKPGVSIIDGGCGPGNITIEIAKKVAPGVVVGIDADEASLAMAKELAKQQGVSNITFKQGDIYNLPFKDESFNIAYSHAVLSNLKEPVQALIEYKRVVKPGGIVAVRESDYSGSLLYPENQAFIKIFNVLSKVGNIYGDLFIGKKLRKLFYDANLKNTIATASCESYGTEQNLKEFAHYLVSQIEEEEIRRIILTNDWATEEQLTQYAKLIENFSDYEITFFSYNWVGCIGFKY